MNKKLLALLLLLPVLLFAADKALGLNTPGGGHGPRKKGVKTSAPVKPADEVESASKLGMIRLADLDREGLRSVKSHAVGMQKRLEKEEERSEFRESHLTRRGSDLLSADQWTFLDREIGDVMEKMDIFSLMHLAQFSRCASGYKYELLVEDGKVSNRGYLVRQRGCMRLPFGVFTVDFVAGRVGVELPENGGLLAIRDYLELLAQG